MPVAESVIDAARQPFLDVAADIHGSLVYLDAGASEAAQLSLGPSFLLGLGAANVCSLEQAHPDDALLPLLASGGQPVTSLVVFATQLLVEAHQQLLHLLMVHPQATRCLIFCSVSELAHAQLAPELCDLSVEAYAEYAAELRQGLAARRAAAGLLVPREESLALSVRHLPLHIAALDAQTFVLPAASAPAAKAIAGGRAAGFGGADVAAGDDADGADVGAASALSLLSHALADLSRVLGGRLEPFAIGPVSTAVAKELATLPQAGQRSGGADSSSGSPRVGADGVLGPSASAAAAGAIALVLVDRALDLATPCMHAEHVLDMMLAGLLRPAPGAPPASAPAAAAATGGAAGQQQQQQQPVTPWVSLRPADLRLDIPQLAPLCPLPPPPPAPATPPPQQPKQQQQRQQERDRDSGGGSGSEGEGGKEGTSDAAAAAAAAAATPAGAAAATAGTVAATSTSAPPPSAAATTAAAAAPAELWQGSMGCSLFHPEDGRWLGWLRQLWPKPSKDVLLLLRKWLREALRAEKVAPARTKLTTAVSPAELAALAGALTGASPGVFLRHQPIIGLALATAQALATEQPAAAAAATDAAAPAPAAVWARLHGYERQLLLALPDGSQAAELLLPMLLEAIQSAHPSQGRLALDDVLQLLVATYSLSGDRMPPAPPLYSADEAQLREALADVILALAHAAAGAASAPPQAAAAAAVEEAREQQQQRQQQQVQEGAALAALWQHLHGLPHTYQLLAAALHAGQLTSDADVVRVALLGHMQEVFQRLRWCAAARGKLRDVRRLMEVEADTGAASSAVPLLRSVLAKILLQAENRDLVQAEAANFMGGLLTKGLGRLGLGLSGITAPAGGRGRTTISDYGAVLLFVVGGLSPAEVRGVRAELEQHVYGHKPLVLLGGSSLLSPSDAARLFLS